MCAACEPGSGITASPTTATPTTQVDDATQRVTRWDFRPGEATGWHRHEYPYAVVPLVDGVLRIVDAAGTRDVPLKAGASYARPAGVEHDVINAGDGVMSFVEVEWKGGQPLPASL